MGEVVYLRSRQAVRPPQFPAAEDATGERYSAPVRAWTWLVAAGLSWGLMLVLAYGAWSLVGAAIS